MMRYVWLFLSTCAGFLGANEPAGAGTVVGRDGKSYVGKIAFKSDNQVLIAPREGAAVTLPFVDIAKLWTTDVSPEPPAPTTRMGSTLPAPWRHCDIGDVKVPGDAKEIDRTFTVLGAGWGIWGANDSCHIVYQTVEGDFDLTARLAEAPTNENFFMGGLAVRQAPDPVALQVSVMVQANGALRMNSRPIRGTRSIADISRMPNPLVRLIRAGDVFAGYCSADGLSWQLVGKREIKMTGLVYAGLAGSATANEDLAAAKFDHLSMSVEPMGPARGMGLVDGSRMTAKLGVYDGKTIKYVDSIGSEHEMPAESVAYLFNAPLPRDILNKMLKLKAGLWLANGDSIESDVKGLGDGKIALESMLFGPQTMNFAQVALAVLRPVSEAGDYRVYCSDGSIYRCRDVKVSDGKVTVESAAMGTLNFKVTELIGLEAVLHQP